MYTILKTLRVQVTWFSPTNIRNLSCLNVLFLYFLPYYIFHDWIVHNLPLGQFWNSEIPYYRTKLRRTKSDEIFWRWRKFCPTKNLVHRLSAHCRDFINNTIFQWTDESVRKFVMVSKILSHERLPYTKNNVYDLVQNQLWGINRSKEINSICQSQLKGG